MSSRLYSPMDIDLFVQQAGDTGGGGGGGGSSNGLKVVYTGPYAGRPDGSLLSKKEIIYCTDIGNFGGAYMRPNDIGNNEYIPFALEAICQRTKTLYIPDDETTEVIIDTVIFPDGVLSDLMELTISAQLFLDYSDEPPEVEPYFEYIVLMERMDDPENPILLTSAFEPSIVDKEAIVKDVTIKAFFIESGTIIAAHFAGNNRDDLNVTQLAPLSSSGSNIKITIKIAKNPTQDAQLIVVGHSIGLKGV